ncbi:MAG: DUF2279 domain-containing protein, partial [Chitinophagaceae bacterium]
MAINSWQDSLPASKNNYSLKSRPAWVGAFHVAGYGSTLTILNNTWYKNFPRTSLHSFNDSREWMQMDKIGHAWSAYGLSRASTAAWKWAGWDSKKASTWGSLSGFTFLTIIEVLDARSAKWGWSWSDVAANTFGTGLYLSQELLWQEQRAYLKFSFHKMHTPDPALLKRGDELFGNSWTERMLKDYNGQTYWLSFNLHSFWKNSQLPKWLNLSLGYGANGMWGGFDNTARNEFGEIIFDRRDISRTRRFLLSPDIDFLRIPTNKKWVRSLLFVLN